MSDSNPIRVSNEASDASDAGPIACPGASSIYFELAAALARQQARQVELLSVIYWHSKSANGDDGQFAHRDLMLAKAERKDWVRD